MNYTITSNTIHACNIQELRHWIHAEPIDNILYELQKTKPVLTENDLDELLDRLMRMMGTAKANRAKRKRVLLDILIKTKCLI